MRAKGSPEDRIARIKARMKVKSPSTKRPPAVKHLCRSPRYCTWCGSSTPQIKIGLCSRCSLPYSNRIPAIAWMNYIRELAGLDPIPWVNRHGRRSREARYEGKSA